jgi:hypothetical protein
MSSRLRKIHEATRPKMFGRAMVSGPSGSGKTWTSLSIASYLVAFENFLAAGGNAADVKPGDIDLGTVEKKDILVVDTEKESALTYADVFQFSHLGWAPPYDPTELRSTLEELESDPPKVVIIDSFSKFWHGQGGILDLAGGAIGGWKTARPMQEALVEQVLSTSAHIILGVRSKMEYAIEQSHGKTTVAKLGLSPMQDDNLVYEMNVAFDISMDHQITVTKSRTMAVPVGRMYPAGMERKLAEDYSEWLAGGVPPAAREDVDKIVDRFAQIASKEDKIAVKTDFVERFGMPHSLTADRVAPANQWLDSRLADLDTVAQEASEEAASVDESDEPAAEAPSRRKGTSKPESAAEEPQASPTTDEKAGPVDKSTLDDSPGHDGEVYDPSMFDDGIVDEANA